MAAPNRGALHPTHPPPSLPSRPHQLPLPPARVTLPPHPPPPRFLRSRSVRMVGRGGGYTSSPPVSACLRARIDPFRALQQEHGQAAKGPKGGTAKQGDDVVLVAGEEEGGITGPERAGDPPQGHTQPAAAARLGPALNLLAPCPLLGPLSTRPPHMERFCDVERGPGRGCDHR